MPTVAMDARWSSSRQWPVVAKLPSYHLFGHASGSMARLALKVSRFSGLWFAGFAPPGLRTLVTMISSASSFFREISLSWQPSYRPVRTAVILR